MNTDVMFSSKTDNWATPPDVFADLNKQYHFNLDPSANHESCKCDYYFTVKEDGLQQNWNGYTVFCNPPYGREIGKWVEKAYNTYRESNNTIVLLLPARTDTRWFHEFILNKAEIIFVRGRLKFGGSENSAPFPSMIVIYKPNGINVTIQNPISFDYEKECPIVFL